jgi:putative membrane protein
MQSRAHPIAGAVLAAALIACTRTDAEEADDLLDHVDPSTTPPAAKLQPATPPRTAMQPASEEPPGFPDDEASGSDAITPMTDEQVLAVLAAYGDKEMAAARLAQQRGRSKDVRTYAAMVLAHGQAAKLQRTRLAQAGELTLQRSDLSQEIADDKKEDLDRLLGASRESFDETFVTIMLHDKRALLVFLDERDEGAVKSRALHTLIVEARKVVESDLRATEALESILNEAPPPPQPKRGPMPGPAGV